MALVVLAPPLAVGAGLGANRMLDRSAATEHEVGVIAWVRPAKSRAYCRVTSWRGRASEELSAEFVGDRCGPGTTLIVSAHSGFLGWPWIERVSAR